MLKGQQNGCLPSKREGEEVVASKRHLNKGLIRKANQKSSFGEVDVLEGFLQLKKLCCEVVKPT